MILTGKADKIVNAMDRLMIDVNYEDLMDMNVDGMAIRIEEFEEDPEYLDPMINEKPNLVDLMKLIEPDLLRELLLVQAKILLESRINLEKKIDY